MRHCEAASPPSAAFLVSASAREPSPRSSFPRKRPAKDEQPRFLCLAPLPLPTWMEIFLLPMASPSS